VVDVSLWKTPQFVISAAVGAIVADVIDIATEHAPFTPSRR